ncbi:SPOR domain-containing protein [Roseobacter sp. YSTF-M11]|uniref:SPOR domain-containing protein n=1 Tax=Roseobacter insulae TaxID=2859783 RepID=A0A9X1K4C0_9RHOB|nr:SPOR domain-containing protein [Roseobacter insulae]MBW4710458.1 SPOR domain-containing protein [Roseobacter insulae]
MSGNIITLNRISTARTIMALCAVGVLAGCEEGSDFNFKDVFAPKPEATAQAPDPARSTNVIERDVEAPEVFSATEPGLWDGRPSLGGVWVAHPDVTEPERVIIRNQTNGQFVVGALFRRERDIPGPRLQISSDAAEALGVLAGAPVDLDVTALVKETVEETPVTPAAEAIEAPDDISETSLDPIAAAGAAIETADPTPGEITASAAATSAPAAPVIESTLPKTTLKKPYVQIGIFSQEANAERAAKQMQSAGLKPVIKAQEAGGKPFWRVIVGPATTTSEQNTLLTKIKGEGFSDAYAVTN